jgi:DNA-binding GntR family transcriptional regulator
MQDGEETSVVERRTVAEHVYRALKRDIIMLRHRPGASLTESDLAALYGSSRVPVRESCRRLQQEGFLTSLPYKGYFVTQISLKEIGDSFDLREVLETHAIALAARSATAVELDRFETLAATEYTYHDWTSYADFLDRNFDFHVQLAALARNDRLVVMLRDLLSSMQRFFFLGLDLGDFASEMRTEHEELVRLLQLGNDGEAANCLRRQIRASRDRILRALIDDRIDLPLK